MISPAESRPKLIVFGLDCAEPSLVFNRLAPSLPTFRKLAEGGFTARLRSTDPPVTIPAWATLTTGRDPGQLGLYGIRNRVSYEYDSLRVSTSNDIHVKHVWDILADHGNTSVLVGIPQTWPVKTLNGACIAGIPAPDTRRSFTWPESLRDDLLQHIPGYEIDIGHFRSMSPQELVNQLFSITRARFAAFRYLMKTRVWDFAMMVEIALDRLHHAFWHFMDSTHPLYIPGSPFQDTIPAYYDMLDTEIAHTMAMLPSDCGILIVSDHGAQPMLGGVRINHWLMQQGYLTLSHIPETESPLQAGMINLQKTTAWGEGGYFGRIFLNVKGREPAGIIAPSDYENMRNKLAAQLEAMVGPDDKPLGNRVLFPDRHYSESNGIPPDLIVYFGELAWRSLGGVGPNPESFCDGLFTQRNDRGPDGANHDFDGICIGNFKFKTPFSTGTFDAPGRLNITSVASEILHYFDIKPIVTKNTRI
jgi:predicted AlkP superfamily phosphohydrolase/phosphomutase